MQNKHYPSSVKLCFFSIFISFLPLKVARLAARVILGDLHKLGSYIINTVLRFCRIFQQVSKLQCKQIWHPNVEMAAPSSSAFSSSRVAALYAKRQLAKDQVLRCYTDNVRLSLVRCPLSVQKGVDRFHVKNREAAVLYSRALAASSLMSSMLKGEERISLEFT